ncbi:phosphoribosyl-ATP diphosphatase [Mucispirillum schaedleri]|mgnify:CR=1 FL=1|jgi:phosphoribosyl-ATP pyrophosphohydrolase/phosphoribosyl-ATP pyrophosphohydrolase/phosphoribosyl-AMP cyclohydrolase|uniref:phosphoribosyl-ATP diphosphatase n=1 Tax=Mucispirillum schaedleri ASF457 TaxID=1379858 RepID=V2QGX5_9BACT|nr:phosphoribosyl-ATP diphosphatase [Mucispirillum schaedleri]MCX4360812.1 phosphoribosyl-ATP diphosphatase [Mucispirillum schaedleri]USF23575.1 Phosphoribosyl-ATP pyrophosphatase [Mucispirillum schaedleri ASF457]SIW08058.1 Phosphoribosyl-ATP diphosphatase [Mucispirillum schaedleri ASF457]
MENILLILNETIKDRHQNPSPASYTTTLFEGGANKIIKKLGEENAEFIKAFLTEPPYETAAEAADYIYHLMVALRFKGIDWTDVLKELEKRHALKGDK